MKPNIGVLLFTLGWFATCWGQESPKKSVPSGCTKMIRVHGSFPKGPVKALPGETYKRPPTVKYLIQEDGTVSDVTLEHSSGLDNMDKKFRDAIANWRYKPRPAGCGVIETHMTPTIHWGEFH